MIDTTHELRMVDLGRLAYAPALAVQRQTHAAVVAGEALPTVLFVEHDPVITISRRKTASANLIADEATLATLGIDVQPTDRGGDITYHGPGQLVAYPIIRLAPLKLSISRYMRVLEEIIIETLAPFGVRGVRDACATGVWVGEGDRRQGTGDSGQRTEDRGQGTGDRGRSETGEAGDNACAVASSQHTAKIAALGVRLSRGVTLHGLALNVSTDLRHFQTIVPCGLAGRAVTSMAQLLGDPAPTLSRVKEEMEKALRRHLTVR